jgi:hypothetical protein
MTTTPTTVTTTDRLLEAFAAGAGVPTELYAEDAVLDATVPMWRFPMRGPAAIAAKFGVWFAHPGRFEELDRHVVDGGEVINYTFTFVADGIPHAARHCHVLRFDDEGRIVRDTFFCGGQWDATLLARMAEEDNAG